MKKGFIAQAAMMLAALGMGATGSTAAAQQNNQNQRHHNEAIDRQLSPVRRGPVTPLNPCGIGGMTFLGNEGNTPKAYGQWLQQAGRQKWVKAKRK